MDKHTLDMFYSKDIADFERKFIIPYFSTQSCLQTKTRNAHSNIGRVTPNREIIPIDINLFAKTKTKSAIGCIQMCIGICVRKRHKSINCRLTNSYDIIVPGHIVHISSVAFRKIKCQRGKFCNLTADLYNKTMKRLAVIVSFILLITGGAWFYFAQTYPATSPLKSILS